MGNKLRRLALALCVAACGGKTAGEEEIPSSGSGIDSTKRVNALNDAERGTLCDFAVGKLGGYGAFRDCGNQLGFRAPKDRKSCIAIAQKPCDATVGNVEACSAQISCDNLFPSACTPLLNCAFITK